MAQPFAYVGGLFVVIAVFLLIGAVRNDASQMSIIGLGIYFATTVLLTAMSITNVGVSSQSLLIGVSIFSIIGGFLFLKGGGHKQIGSIL